MVGRGPSDYEALYLDAVKGREQAEEQQRQAEEQRRRAEERNQATTFDEYIVACHTLLSAPLKVGHPSRSTKGSIPSPTGKDCPTKLREWKDFPAQQALVYSAVRRILQPAEGDPPRLFSPLIALEDLGRSLCQQPISSEKDLESVERFGKDNHVRNIVESLCKIPSACEKLHLGHGFRFESHINALDEEAQNAAPLDKSLRRMQPDQYCVHRLDDTTNTLLITVEYKPPHKLSVENLCAGLRPMNFWDEVVNTETVPTDAADKLRYNAARLVGAVLVQEYHVMIQEGLAYSCVSTGIALVFLHVPEDDRTTLFYFLCVPNKNIQSQDIQSQDIQSQDNQYFQQPMTAVSRLLCLCLMSCRTAPRSNSWRNAARTKVHRWATDFEHTRSQIPDQELGETPPGSEYVPSSPLASPGAQDSRRTTRSHARCAPVQDTDENDSDSSDSGSGATAPRRKRNYSDIASSPPQVRTPSSNTTAQDRGGQRQHSATLFCTQRCLLGLRHGGLLHDACPNIHKHRNGQDTHRHQISVLELVQSCKKQLDKNLDQHCEPFGDCGAYGAPFKIHCVEYGYTIVGKGTTSQLWELVSREAAVYHILQSVQGSAVPVFLGSVDLAQTYFLHGAGEIQHMLLMAWGGEPVAEQEWAELKRAMYRSVHKIRALGVRHGDLRRQNLLWNEELKRVLIIDFHDVELVEARVESLKRDRSARTGGASVKRRRLVTAQ